MKIVMSDDNHVFFLLLSYGIFLKPMATHGLGCSDTNFSFCNMTELEMYANSEHLVSACRSDLDITSEFGFYHFTSEFQFKWLISCGRCLGGDGNHLYSKPIGHYALVIEASR